MKNKKKKKRIALAFKSFYPILIMVLCLFMSVGYAVVNSVNLTIDGDILAMEQDGVVVTDIVFKESSGISAELSNISVVSNTVLNGNIVLSSSDVSSYITYSISVLNTNDYDCYFSEAIFDSDFYDNENIIFELSDNMVKGMFLKSGESLSFDIKFKYKENVIPSSTINKLNAYINVDFPAVAMLKPTTETDVSGFRAYKEKIKNITFENKIDVPDDAQSWDIGVSETGDVMAYLVTNGSDSNYYDLYIQSDTKLYANEDMSYWFSNLTNVGLLTGLELLDTSLTNNMSYLFHYTGFNNTKFNLNVSSFDTSNVTNMMCMFYYTGYESTVFSLDVSNFNTGKVTNMFGMFTHAGENNTSFTLDVSNFDTSKVTNMSNMFRSTGSNSTVFTLDVSGFDTQNVFKMDRMFEAAGKMSTVFELDVSNFNTSKVNDMYRMFVMAGMNNTSFTLDVSNFDTSNVTDMNSMFYYTGMNSAIFTLDVSNFDTSNVTDMNSMFYRTGQSNPYFTLDVSGFDTSKVTDMYRMFYNTGVSSSKINTSITIRNPAVTSYDGMFLDVAVKAGTKITVNYTKETSDLVDKMIATKSDISNVVKGSLIQ